MICARGEDHYDGKKRNLKSEQPIPDMDALPLPTEIVLRVDKRFRTVVYVCVAVLIVYIIVSNILENGGQFWRSQYALPTLPFIAACVYGTKAFTSKPCFTITDDMVESTVMGITRSIRWDVIDVFCTHANEKTGEPETIELSNASSKVIILWPHPGMRRYYPSIPYVDYARQMEALLSLIAAKTDLLLVELRVNDETQED